MTDQNGTTHTHGMDLLGRPISDAVTTLGSGVDGTVRLRTTNFDTQGGVYQMTAYGSTLGGTVLNQVEDVHNGLGQLTGEYQSQSGAVTTSGPTPTPETQYAYSDPTSGSLMTSMTYPNGRILHYGTNGNALDAAIGRVDYLADDNGSGGVGSHLVDYSFMGAGTMVQQADANGVKLTYLQQSGDSSAITAGPQYAGDAVTGLDRFGQVIDQNWVNATTTPTPTTTDRFQYGRDQAGNVLYKNNLVNGAFSELYHANSATSGDNNSAYDPLNRLGAFARGTLSASSNNGGVLDTVSSPVTTQSWNLDAVGNQASVTTNSTTTTNTTNAKNQLRTNGSSTLTFDSNGNTTTDAAGNTYTYDSWNHIATVKNAAGATIAIYGYNAGGQRIAETAGGATTNFLHNGSQIIELRQGSTVTNQYVYNIDYTNDVLLRDDNSTSGSLGMSGSGLGRRLFEQHGANFNVTALTNTSGVVVQRQVYGPYGTMTVLSPSWASATDAYSFNPGFQEMWQDSVTGLYYTLNRDYDPATGTWAEPDGGYWDGGSLYQALDSRPSAVVDPLGLDPTVPPAPATNPGSGAPAIVPLSQVQTELRAEVEAMKLPNCAGNFQIILDIYNRKKQFYENRGDYVLNYNPGLSPAAASELQRLVAAAIAWNKTSSASGNCMDQATSLGTYLISLGKTRYWTISSEGGFNGVPVTGWHHVVLLNPIPAHPGNQGNPLPPIVVDGFKKADSDTAVRVMLATEFRDKWPYDCDCCAKHDIPAAPSSESNFGTIKELLWKVLEIGAAAGGNN